MKPADRPIPYPPGSSAWESRVDYLAWTLKSRRAAIKVVAAVNRRVREKAAKGERCGAKTRKGTSCLCKAMANGRCKLHGGMSTGPRTVKGKRRALANLKGGTFRFG